MASAPPSRAEEDTRDPNFLRWNVDHIDGEVLVCRGEHEKGHDCEWERYVAEDRFLAAEARASTAEARIAVLEAEVVALRAEPARAAEEMNGLPRIEFHQQDWIPGFAAFLPGATTPSPDSKAFCVLNLGSMLSTVYHGDTKREDLPYFLADSIMHEVIHVLEQWAGVEFSEDRVDALIEKYRALPIQGGGDE